MIARWRAERDRVHAAPEDQFDDFLDRWLPAAAAMLDAGWNGYGMAPSKVLEMRYCMLSRRTPADCAYALRVGEWIKAEATRRHGEGLHPYPLTSERPAVTVGELPRLKPPDISA